MRSSSRCSKRVHIDYSCGRDGHSPGCARLGRRNFGTTQGLPKHFTPRTCCSQFPEHAGVALAVLGPTPRRIFLWPGRPLSGTKSAVFKN